jgi:hypothetical protein
MTPEESKMLNDLADRIAKTPSPAHDPEAEEFIRTRIGSRPDALYLMTQTVLIQNLALEHARQQIQELQQHAAQGPAPAAGSLLGGQRPSGAGYAAAPPPPPPRYSSPEYAQAPPAYQPPPSGGGSSFLRSAATTAAGVAAGALAFEGIRSLLGGHQGGFGGLGGFGGTGFLGGAPGSETIINNYYETPEGSARDEGNYDDSDTREAADRDVDDSGQGGDVDDSGDDSADYSADDSGSDDSGDYDSGGDDSGGGGDWV